MSGLSNGSLDLIKVRLQTQEGNNNAISGAKNVWMKEGPLAFYKVHYCINLLLTHLISTDEKHVV